MAAQCSDGGVCTFSAHAEKTGPGSLTAVSLAYGFGFSGSPDDVSYQSLVIHGTIAPLAGARVTVTLPYAWQSGPLGSASGPGDLLVAWNQTVHSWGAGGRIEAQAGLRLPTGEDNAGPGLPMAYQSGLGSTDILLGGSLSTGALLGGVGYQLAGARNGNDSVRLERGDQLLVWGGYEWGGRSWWVVPQVLVIKQVQESSIRSGSAGGGEFTNVAGSDQLQINLALRARYDFSSPLALEVFGALPLLARDVNVDGLKRTLTLSVGITATL